MRPAAAAALLAEAQIIAAARVRAAIPTITAAAEAAARALGAAWPGAWVRATRLGGGSPPNDHAL